MKKNEDILFPLIKKFYNKIKKEDFVIDKTGAKMIELIAPRIELNPNQSVIDFGVKRTNLNYVEKELNWYLSKSLSIKGYVDDVKIWNDVCTKDARKNINSNYGWCIYSEENGNQFRECLQELIKNQESRRAVMIYTRPTMWKDYNHNGMSDFICTDGVQCFIRKNKLIYIVKQRSCDFIFGFFNDFAWHCYVYNDLIQRLRDYSMNDDPKFGKIIYIPFSFHVYERHFSLIEEMYKKKLL